MSETDPALSDLGPKPDAEIEPGEPNPGGADAVPQGDGVDGEAADADPVPRDLDPDNNPVTGELPLAVTQGEDTSTEATKGDGGEDDDGQGSQESPV
ncbi:hypothetical protein [Nocardioides rubriscoriae]|uniref:hypothetical protein n=1 Tax=Nocardioides rubriscoriae TaxID=642762 RepID=UPI0011E04C20|nr:hypothetical protein [Nocardioides rubriscoriae]